MDRPVSPAWQRALVKLTAYALVCAIVVLPLVSAVHYLIVRPAHPLFLYPEAGLGNPLLYTFEACFAIFLIMSFVVIMLRTVRAQHLEMRGAGIRWPVRGSVEQLIPWDIIGVAEVSDDGKDVILSLAIDRQIRIPRRVYRRLYGPRELCDLINRGARGDQV